MNELAEHATPMGRWLDRLEETPWAGVFSLGVVLMGLALGHSFLVLQRYLTDVPSTLDTIVSMTFGGIGIALVWMGLGKAENQATLMGYIGGKLIWIGIFEWTWEYFAHWLQVQPVTDDGVAILSPGLLLIQVSSLLVIVMLIFLGANKDTRCRMFMWFHRNFRLRPGQMTAGYKRQFSRVTAMETVFITWFIYLCAITINDPRLIGYDTIAAKVITAGFVVWGLYLIPKLLKQRGLGSALRYGIPTANILWLPTEALSRWGIYPEIWVKPLEYDVTMSVVLILFALAGWAVAQSRGVGMGQESRA